MTSVTRLRELDMTHSTHTFGPRWPFAAPVDLGVITTVRALGD